MQTHIVNGVAWQYSLRILKGWGAARVPGPASWQAVSRGKRRTCLMRSVN